MIILPVLMLLIAVAGHFAGLYAGVYELQIAEGRVWYDNVLHALVGAGFALLWLRIGGKELAALGFVAGMAVLWELFEWGFYLLFSTFALGLKVYSPTPQEALLDGFSNLAGAAVLVILPRLYISFRRG